MRTWRRLHRWTVLIFALAIVHTIGAGTDARSAWLLALIALAALPTVFLGTYRLLPRPLPAPGRVTPTPASRRPPPRRSPAGPATRARASRHDAATGSGADVLVDS